MLKPIEVVGQPPFRQGGEFAEALQKGRKVR